MPKSNKTKSKPTETEKESEIFFTVQDVIEGNVPWKDLELHDPIINNYKINGKDVKCYESYYSLDGKDVYFILAKQDIWGISERYGFGVKEEDQGEDTLEGWQISYPLTSLKTVDNPTEDEQAVQTIMNKVYKETLKKVKKFCDDPKIKGKGTYDIPAPTRNSYSGAKGDGNYDDFLKPVYARPMTVDPKTKEKYPDTSKPERMYINLASSGKGKKIVNGCKIYGPRKNGKDTILKPSKCVGEGKRATCLPCVHLRNVYYGAHGDNPHGASIKFKVAQMNYTPISKSGGGPSRNLLPANNDTVEDDESSSDDESSFTDPRGETNFKSGKGKAPGHNSDESGDESEDEKPKKKGKKKQGSDSESGNDSEDEDEKPKKKDKKKQTSDPESGDESEDEEIKPKKGKSKKSKELIKKRKSKKD